MDNGKSPVFPFFESSNKLNAHVIAESLIRRMTRQNFFYQVAF